MGAVRYTLLATALFVVPCLPSACLAQRGPPTVRITAREYVFLAPDTLPAGLTHFILSNEGKERHEALMVRIPEGHTLKEVFASVADSGRVPDWVERSGGPNSTSPGLTTEIAEQLRPGTYVWFCFISAPDRRPHISHGMIRAVTVVAAAPGPGAPEPHADAVVRMTEFAFQQSDPVRSGSRWLRVENAGAKAHEVVVLRLDPGTTKADFDAWFASPGGRRRPAEPVGGIAALEPGAHAFLRVEPEQGRTYVLVCRIEDSASGRTHHDLGMEAELRVN